MFCLQRFIDQRGLKKLVPKVQKFIGKLYVRSLIFLLKYSFLAVEMHFITLSKCNYLLQKIYIKKLQLTYKFVQSHNFRIFVKELGEFYSKKPPYINQGKKCTNNCFRLRNYFATLLLEKLVFNPHQLRKLKPLFIFVHTYFILNVYINLQVIWLQCCSSIHKLMCLDPTTKILNDLF